MSTEIQLPQMGESIYEGTITRWLKNVGERVEADEPLYELSTDKVDTEIPSPVGGILSEIRVKEGEKVPIQTVVAIVDESDGGEVPGDPPETMEKAPESSAEVPVVKDESPGKEDVFASPLVRRIAREKGVDLSRVKGTGFKGRITKENLMKHIESGGDATAKIPPADVATASPVPAPAPAPLPPPPPVREGESVEVVPMSTMRAKIAEHMVMSRRTSPHVTTVFEVDMTDIVRMRNREKDDVALVTGVKLTYTPFFAVAVTGALRKFPIINSSVRGNDILYRKEINLGIAVSLPDGLIVPVIHRADEKSFLGISRSITDLAGRARSKKLRLEDVQGGTFTITNPGIYGGLFAMPIINQPEVAIMGVGGLEQRPVVMNDAIAVRWMCNLSLSFDHRVIDGATADRFMSEVKRNLQEWKMPLR